MNNFSKNLKTDDDLMSRNTLLFRRCPTSSDENLKEKLKAYLEGEFPNRIVTGIQLLYDCTRLADLEQRYVSINDAHEYTFQQNLKLGNDRIRIRPHACSIICGCLCCCSRQVDALEFYGDEKTKVEEKIVKELDSIKEPTLGSVFVSFNSEKSAML